MNRTKIICTLGPSVDSDDKIEELVACGMSVARLNCSHGSFESHARHIRRIRKIEKRVGKSIGIMLDLQGPKLRIGDLPKPFFLHRDEVWQLSVSRAPDEKRRVIPIRFAGLPKAAEIGQSIYLDDGLLQTTVLRKNADSLWVRIVHGGILDSRKGINVPLFRGKLPAMTAKDKKDLLWGLKQDVDFVALSFVRTPEDMTRLRKLVQKHCPKNPPLLVAKIEKPEAMERVASIIRVSDGVLIARGDLGIELLPESVPVAQKQIIEECRRQKKPVIVATQMLDSMRLNPRPTRAEVSDVASAIYEGVDAALLTGETSSGKFPVEACLMMQKIILEVESHMIQKTFRKTPAHFGVSALEDAFLFNSMQLADDISARAIVLLTRQGTLTKILSKFHPKQPIFSLASTPTTYRQLNLYWGVFPIEMPYKTVEKRIETGIAILKRKKVTKKDDRLIFIYRDFRSGCLNLKIVEIP